MTANFIVKINEPINIAEAWGNETKNNNMLRWVRITNFGPATIKVTVTSDYSPTAGVKNNATIEPHRTMDIFGGTTTITVSGQTGDYATGSWE